MTLTRILASCRRLPSLKLLMIAALTSAGMAPFGDALADDRPDAHEVIRRLIERVYVLGETSGNQERFEAAIASAREQIRKMAQRSDGAAIVSARAERSGATPLIAAARQGFVGLVDELLQNPDVIAHIEATDANGLSAWDYANFAYELAIWLCNPDILNEPFIIVPLIVVQPFYRRQSLPPYLEIRRLVEAAGAARDMESVKGKWQTLCTNQGPITRSLVANSTDLHDTVVAEALQLIRRRNPMLGDALSRLR